MHLVVVERRGDAVGCPLLPPGGGLGEAVVHHDRGGWLPVRRIPGQRRIHRLAGGYRELGDVRVVGCPQLRSSHDDGIRTRDRHEPVPVFVLRLSHPGECLRVVEAETKIHHHGHGSPDAGDTADNIRSAVAVRHEVRDLHLAIRRHPSGHEDEGVCFVPSRRRHDLASGGEQPPSVVLGAKERSEGRGGVESGKTEPVDAAVAPDQTRGVAVADQGIVLNAQRHFPSLAEVA